MKSFIRAFLSNNNRAAKVFGLFVILIGMMLYSGYKAPMLTLSIRDILQDPQEHIGKHIDVGGLDVASIQEDGIIAKRYGQEIFVHIQPTVNGDALRTLSPGSKIELAGTVIRDSEIGDVFIQALEIRRHRTPSHTKVYTSIPVLIIVGYLLATTYRIDRTKRIITKKTYA
jgi:hypothetical protein